MSHDNIKQALLGAGELPTMPVVATKILALLSSADYSTKDLSRLIQNDVGITTKILKIANSAFYGCSREITSVDRAVVLLGARTMKSLVIAASTKGVYKNSGLIEHMLWENGVGVAIGSHMIANELKIQMKEDALVSGLLHNIGKVIMLQRFPDEFHDAYQEMYNEEKEFEDIDEKHFGFSYTELGALLVKTWKLSEVTEHAIGYQNHPEDLSTFAPEYIPITATIRLARDICIKSGIGTRQAKEDLNLLETPGAQLLGLDEEQVSSLCKSVLEKYEIEKNLFS